MKFRIEVICVSENGTEERTKVTAIERQELAMETLGLNLAEGKSILEGLQDFGRRTALPVRSYAGGLGTAGAARRPDNGGNRWRLRPSSSRHIYFSYCACLHDRIACNRFGSIKAQ
jgi:hypothetical protein